MQELLNKVKAGKAAVGEEDDYFDDDPFDDDYLFNPNEDMIYDSPLEGVEANLYFQQLMSELDPELRDNLASLLNEEQ